MKRIRKEEITKLKEIISELPNDPNDDAVFFFPIELEKKTIENETGVSMNLSLSSMKKGANLLVNYGIVKVQHPAEVVGVVCDLESSITIDLTDYLQLVDNEKLNVLAEYDCKLIKKSSISFSIQK